MGLFILLVWVWYLVCNDLWMVSVFNKSVFNGIVMGIQVKLVWGLKEYKKKFIKLWICWGKYVDVDGVLGWEGLQVLFWCEWNEVGEVFVWFCYWWFEDGLLVLLQVQLIELEQCLQYYNGVVSNGNVI